MKVKGVTLLSSASGRILSVCGIGQTREDAALQAYAAVSCVRSPQLDFRRDVGAVEEDFMAAKANPKTGGLSLGGACLSSA